MEAAGQPKALVWDLGKPLTQGLSYKDLGKTMNCSETCGRKFSKRLGSLESLEKPRDGQVSKKEEKVLESGSGQASVLGARTVRDLAVYRAEKEQQVLFHDVSGVRREGRRERDGQGQRQQESQVYDPSPSLISPIPPRDRARNRIRNHMVTGVQELQEVSLERWSLLGRL